VYKIKIPVHIAAGITWLVTSDLIRNNLRPL